MNENNPNQPENRLEHLSPEQIEAEDAKKRNDIVQADARELLDAREKFVNFRPQHAKGEMAEATNEILKSGKHNEAGVELENVYPESRVKEGVNKLLSFKQSVEKVEKLMASSTGKEAKPNDIMNNFSDFYGENQQKAA